MIRRMPKKRILYERHGRGEGRQEEELHEKKCDRRETGHRDTRKELR